MKDDEIRRLLLFVASVANIATGKLRTDANAILRAHELPTVPLSAGASVANEVYERCADAINARAW